MDDVVGPRRKQQPHSGQFFVGSRVSLVCNVCSRLLPKEWFAERPMASARANSRVPPPRHLCIIMLSPPYPGSRSLLSPSLLSPTLSSLREVCPLLPSCRPSSHNLLFPLPSSSPSAPTLSHFLSTLVSFCVGKRERERRQRKRNIR